MIKAKSRNFLGIFEMKKVEKITTAFEICINNWSICKSKKKKKKRDGTSYPEGQAFPAGMVQPSQMRHENLS